MSGGHYQYQYRYLEYLADEIERDFINDGVICEKYGNDTDHKYDLLSDATDEEREIILDEVKRFIVDLRQLAIRAKELEWYTSGDTGATSYLKRLNELYKI
jgi:hypothetical protein